MSLFPLPVRQKCNLMLNIYMSCDPDFHFSITGRGKSDIRCCNCSTFRHLISIFPSQGEGKRASDAREHAPGGLRMWFSEFWTPSKNVVHFSFKTLRSSNFLVDRGGEHYRDAPGALPGCPGGLFHLPVRQKCNPTLNIYTSWQPPCHFSLCLWGESVI